ncbi:hypothetical protein HK099_003746 [Clydaea vesicula]|uniref:UBC core domain-containing protein n=1 Tax=Clydaea vesicula TaxID=447962 RepID=A0AAD5Y356_9FUNG|nr:hypothetical protein HK099_003746 [Clydaea vesicula]
METKEEDKKEENALSKHFFSAYFRRFDKNLSTPNHLPAGLYVMPVVNNLYEWYGVIFIHRGYYKEGVFKFKLTIPESYPLEGPKINFITDMFHPLISTNFDREFSLKQQFSKWRPQKDFICHVLHYLKNCFKEAVLSNLQEQYCLNKEAYSMFFTEREAFAKLAGQCAQLSSSPDTLFDNESLDANCSLLFTKLSDDEYENIRENLLKEENNEVKFVDTEQTSVPTSIFE